ncbi:MAG: mechanosensitive ion channel domain-containing protein, partial [Cyanobacteria bacterium P01_D01_bin.56]
MVSLRINGREESLATVSEVDLVDPGYALKSQGRDWAQAVEDAFSRAQQERDPTYVRRAVLYSLGLFVGAIAIHLLLSFISSRSAPYLDRWLSSPVSPLALWERPIKFFWQLGLLGLKIGLWLITFFEITRVFPDLRSWRYQLGYFLTARSIVLGDQNYSALSLLFLLGLTVGLWFAARFVAQLLRIYILKRAQVEPRLQDIISVVTQYVLLFLGVIVLLQAFGINASSLAILASVLGVGIGFGVQNIANNFISGFIITLERPIQVGDFIKIGDLVGIVKQVGARSTEITTLDKVTIIVPNSRFLESEVINWSHGDSVSRVRVPVGVAYGSDISQVKAALLEAVKRHPEVLLRPKPEVWFQSFGDSALNFEVMVWTGDPRKQFRVKSDLNYEIEASLRRHDIEIPFPQQDLHLRSPQLDEILTILKQQSIGIAPPQASPPTVYAPAEEDPEQPVEQTTEQTSALPDLLANLDEEALAEAMRGPDGIPLQALPGEPNGAQTYFSGAAVVSWLQKKRDYDRAGAMLVGKWLLQKGLICALAEDGDFEDSPALFQFYQDSPAALAK